MTAGRLARCNWRLRGKCQGWNRTPHNMRKAPHNKGRAGPEYRRAKSEKPPQSQGREHLGKHPQTLNLRQYGSLQSAQRRLFLWRLSTAPSPRADWYPEWDQRSSGDLTLPCPCRTGPGSVPSDQPRHPPAPTSHSCLRPARQCQPQPPLSQHLTHTYVHTHTLSHIYTLTWAHIGTHTRL